MLIMLIEISHPNSSLRTGSRRGWKKNSVSAKKKNERSNRGRTGETVDFVFDVRIRQHN